AVSAERNRLRTAAGIVGNRQRSRPGTRGRRRKGHVDGAIGTGGQSRRARGARDCTGTCCGKIPGSRKRVDGQSGGAGVGEGYRHRCAGGSELLITAVSTLFPYSTLFRSAVSAERNRLRTAAGIVGNRQRSRPRTQGRRRKGHVDRAIGTGGQGRRAREAGTCTGKIGRASCRGREGGDGDSGGVGVSQRYCDRCAGGHEQLVTKA